MSSTMMVSGSNGGPDEEEESCPICGGSLQGMDSRSIQRHVNRCLDGGADTPPAEELEGGASTTSLSLGSASDPDATAPSNNANGAPVVDMEESLMLLLQMYPSLPPAYAANVLMACDGNLDAATGLLGEMAFQDQAADQAARQKQWEKEIADREERRLEKRNRAWTTPVDVEVIVYDLKPDGMSSKIGFGVYHSAVIIGHDREFAFGGTQDPSQMEKPGVFVCEPECAADVIKKRYKVGKTRRTPAEVFNMMDEWGKKHWTAGDYHLLNKNCNHFTAHLLAYLSEAAVLPPLVELDVKYGVPSTTGDGAPPSPPSDTASLRQGDVLKSRAQGTEPTESSSHGSGGGGGGSGSTRKKPHEVDDAWLRSVLPEEKIRKKYIKERRRVLEDALEIWNLPDWVNRAARFGSSVVPNFVYEKVVGKAAQETPNEDNSALVETPTATTTRDAPEVVTPTAPKTAVGNPSGFSQKSPPQGPQKSPPSPPATEEFPVDPEQVKLVKEVLPDAPDEHVVLALRRCKGNVEQAMEFLIRNSQQL